MVQVAGHLAVDNLSGGHYRQSSIFSSIVALQMPGLLATRRRTMVLILLLTRLKVYYPMAAGFGVACPLPLDFGGQRAASHLDWHSVDEMVVVAALLQQLIWHHRTCLDHRLLRLCLLMMLSVSLEWDR